MIGILQNKNIGLQQAFQWEGQIGFISQTNRKTTMTSLSFAIYFVFSFTRRLPTATFGNMFEFASKVLQQLFQTSDSRPIGWCASQMAIVVNFVLICIRICRQSAKNLNTRWLCSVSEQVLWHQVHYDVCVQLS